IEGSVKILDALRERAPGAAALSADGAAAALVDLAVWVGLLPLDAADRPNLADALEDAIFGTDLANSISANVERLHRAAAGVRDRIPADMWRALGFLEEWSGRPSAGHLPPFDEMRAALAALAGYQHEAMARDLGWLFLDLGRRLERSLFLVSVLQGAGVVNRKPGGDPWVLDALLEVVDAVLIYRERYTTPPRRQPTLHLLVADAGNPRSLAFQLARMDEHLDRLPGLPAEPGTGADPMAGVRRILAEARSAVADLAVLDDDASLRRLVDTLNGRLPAITELLAHGYFIHATIRRA
ncbi:MAG TPA: alpha-E domain-containing protein, partial [Arenibaculum sp.]|nr:alpha-E domain-containing protein [Arenibaculum sp.]